MATFCLVADMSPTCCRHFQPSKDEHRLPYINLTKSGLEAVRMLMQVSKETEKEELREVKTGLSCVQTVHGNYEGFTQ